MRRMRLATTLLRSSGVKEKEKAKAKAKAKVSLATLSTMVDAPFAGLRGDVKEKAKESDTAKAVAKEKASGGVAATGQKMDTCGKKTWTQAPGTGMMDTRKATVASSMPIRSTKPSGRRALAGGTQIPRSAILAAMVRMAMRPTKASLGKEKEKATENARSAEASGTTRLHFPFQARHQAKDGPRRVRTTLRTLLLFPRNRRL